MAFFLTIKKEKLTHLKSGYFVTSEKEKESSRKGAWYYRFDANKYEDLLKRGFNFEL